jgi:hypothetical protein
MTGNQMGFLMRDLNVLFRNSLLITGSIELTEHALHEAIGVLSELQPPTGTLTRDVTALEVARSSASMLFVEKSASDLVAECVFGLIPEQLHPVLELPAKLRCWFVLRTLLAYSSEQVSILMNIPSEDVQELAADALISFAKTSREREQKVLQLGVIPGLQGSDPKEESA